MRMNTSSGLSVEWASSTTGSTNVEARTHLAVSSDAGHVSSDFRLSYGPNP
jgi:hypothetical protein